jgi:Zn-finger nucleic acid-binding protein
VNPDIDAKHPRDAKGPFHVAFSSLIVGGERAKGQWAIRDCPDGNSKIGADFHSPVRWAGHMSGSWGASHRRAVVRRCISAAGASPFEKGVRDMKCPVCNEVDLTMSDRQGIEIDYCPKCRGVWLDRGELDKIIERSQAYESAPPPPPPAGYPTRQEGDSDYDDDDDRRQRGYPQPPYGQQAPYVQPRGPGAPPPGQAYPPPPHPHYRKKKSFWSELFD